MTMTAKIKEARGASRGGGKWICFGATNGDCRSTNGSGFGRQPAKVVVVAKGHIGGVL